MNSTMAVLIAASMFVAIATHSSADTDGTSCRPSACGGTSESAVFSGGCGSTPGAAETEKSPAEPQPSCGSAAPELTRGGYRMHGVTGTVEIPFELMNEHVVIPVSVNGGEPFRLVLDTGMPFYGATLNPSARTDALELLNPDGLQVLVAGAEDYTPRIGSGVTLGLPGVELTDQMVMVVPMPGCGQTRALIESDGVIGLSVFDNFVVEIDYDNRTLTLTEPDGFVYEGTGTEIPIRLGSVRMPEVDLAIETEDDRTIPVGLVVDTGAALAMSITLGTSDKLSLPLGAKDLVVGYSSWGEVRGKLGRVETLRLEGLRLDDVLVTFFEQGAPGVPPCGKNGLLGSSVLQRFTVTFDYTRGRMFLEPGARFNEPFEFSMTGLAYRRTDDGAFEVVRVFPDTPASESGMAEGDIILSIDDVLARDCDESTMREAMSREVPRVQLRIARDGNEMDVALKPRRLI